MRGMRELYLSIPPHDSIDFTLLELSTSMPTRGQAIADSAHVDTLGQTVAAHQNSKEAKYGQ